MPPSKEGDDVEDRVPRKKFGGINAFLLKGRGNKDNDKKGYYSDRELSCKSRGQKGSGGRLEAHAIRHGERGGDNFWRREGNMLRSSRGVST